MMQSHRPLFTLQHYPSIDSSSSSYQGYNNYNDGDDDNDDDDNIDNKIERNYNKNKMNNHRQQHQNKRGNNGVTSLTFLHQSHLQQQRCNKSSINNENDNSHDNVDDDDDDMKEIPIFQCRSKILNHHSHNHTIHHNDYNQQHDRIQNYNPIHHYYNHNYDIKAKDQATTLSFTNNQTFLASCHVNGEAYVWDLNKRHVKFSLLEKDHDDWMKRNGNGDSRVGNVVNGPGLTVLRLDDYSYNNNGNEQDITSSSSSSMSLLYQTRDLKGTISFHDISSSTMDGCRMTDKIHCYSKTFCQATSSSSYHGLNPNIIASPSNHESVISLWDRRVGNCSDSNSGNDNNSSCDRTNTNIVDRKQIAFIHGSGLDMNSNSSSSDWRKDGMVMSLKFCNWGTHENLAREGNNGFVLGCGMENGNVYFHDLRKMNSSGGVVHKDDKALDRDGEYTFKSVGCTSINLGMNPVLTLDMLPSTNKTDNSNNIIRSKRDKNDHHNSTRSLIAIAGTAGDASEQLELPELQRGTVNIIKVSSPIENKIKTRIRAKVGTCNISHDASFLGKPGVGQCRFKPDGSVFAVGGWDKRIRIFSRTTAKLLGILRGPNDDSITALDWAVGDKDLMDCGVLAAGSGDGKITIWRT